LKCVYRERAGISLFDALHTSASPSRGDPMNFPPETIQLVSRTLSRFRSIALDDYGVPIQHFTVFATEAMRRAQNAGTMLEAIESTAPGVSVKILAPEVETLFGSMGARSGFVDVKGLFLDLGGGSVQMTYMDTYAGKEHPESSSNYGIAAAQAGKSLPYGAARLIQVLEGADVDLRAAEVSKLQLGMTEAFQNLRNLFPSLGHSANTTTSSESDQQGIDIYLCGGGFRGYGSMLMHNDPIQPYPIPSIGTYTVSGHFFGKTKEMLQVNDSYGGKIYGMSKRRRSQFSAIVTVIEALVGAVPNIRSVTFCSGGNREGALFMTLPEKIRESDPIHVVDLASQPSMSSTNYAEVMEAVLGTIQAALPLTEAPTIFSLDIGHLFATQIWGNIGEDADSNASSCLHEAITRDPSHPGMSHLKRAILSLTLSARWGSGLAPADSQLKDKLRQLADAAHPDASFWAEYIGAVAATVATVVPGWPKTASRIKEAIK
jgi:retrograde regulation protein 2